MDSRFDTRYGGGGPGGPGPGGMLPPVPSNLPPPMPMPGAAPGAGDYYGDYGLGGYGAPAPISQSQGVPNTQGGYGAQSQSGMSQGSYGGGSYGGGSGLQSDRLSFASGMSQV
jgi:hypothetical protein